MSDAIEANVTLLTIKGRFRFPSFQLRSTFTKAYFFLQYYYVYIQCMEPTSVAPRAESWYCENLSLRPSMAWTNCRKMEACALLLQLLQRRLVFFVFVILYLCRENCCHPAVIKYNNNKKKKMMMISSHCTPKLSLWSFSFTSCLEVPCSTAFVQ